MNIEILLMSSVVILFFISIFFIVKLYILKYTIKEIEESINNILKLDTNNLITISSSDKDIKNLTINLNNNLIELRKQKLKYENGNQELKKIITNISHDLRTPLTAINGYIELIDNNGLKEKQKKYIEIVQRKTNELNELTTQLFEFSKTIDINIKKEKCCLNEILEETLVSYYNIFREKNIVPSIFICNKKIYRKVNKISLIRIFENILSNVSKYSNGDFKVEMNENGTIIFSNESNFLDTTTVQKIFDRYFSVENAKESTGIGLSIAKQLVELNNGRIYAKYTENKLFIEISFE